MEFSVNLIYFGSGLVVGVLIAVLSSVSFAYLVKRRLGDTDNLHIKTLKEHINEIKAEREELAQKLSETEITLSAKEERIKAFDTITASTKIEFKNLAQEIFEEKNRKFKAQSEESLEIILKPLNQKIEGFNRQITEFSAINERMTTEAGNLSRALTHDVKAQGNWGEITLERILEESGLRKDHEYTVQGVGLEIKSHADNRLQKPDVIVKLPDEKHIIIDSKLSLRHYIAFSNAPNDDERHAATKKFRESVKRHINGLGDKSYETASGLNAPDFVMMFMPIEASYFLLMQSDYQKNNSLQSLAWEKNIVIVCPSTLYASLRTVASLWKLQHQNQNAHKISELAGRIYDKVVGFATDMQKIGTALGKAQTHYTGAINKMSQGHGNIMTQTKNLKTMGAITSKSLPPDLIEQNDPDNGDLPDQLN